MLSLLLYIVIVIFLIVMSMFLPIGNENSIVRRLPWVTFSIMAINVVIYYATLPVLAGDIKAMLKAGTELDKFMQQHQELLWDEGVRDKLVEVGFVPKEHVEGIKDQLKKNPSVGSEFESWLKSSEGKKL